MRVISRALSRNSIFKRTFCSMFLMILVPKVTGAAEFSAVLKPEHESFTWRRIANRTEPTLNKTFHWIRHEQIGIGNTLGGYVTSMISALREDRLLVITSRILFKFCDVVKCSVEPLMAPYKKKVGANVSIGSAYYFKVGYAANELNGIRDIINAVGCAFQQPIIANRQVPGKKRYLNVDYDWPKRCLYSKIVRSLVESGDGMLQKRKEWLRTFFVGDRYRFDFVISIVKDNILPVYDYVLHLRTIALIEDMTTEDGLPANLKEKSDAFVASAAFENMVQCFAAEIAKGSVQKSKISRSTMKSGWLQADRTVNIYVTTDCAQIRAEFAERIKSAVVVRLASNHDGPKMLQKLSPLSFIGNSTQEHRLVPPLVEVSDWKVAVDYFNGNLSAAHFFVWTMPNKEMKESDWGEIIGTVGDWLFMGQGQTMLTVKGTKGGERALPSSFAMSAAGFGVTEYVKSLRGSAAGSSTSKMGPNASKHFLNINNMWLRIKVQGWFHALALVITRLTLFIPLSSTNSAELPLPLIRHSLQLVGFHGDQCNFHPRSPMMRWTGHLGMRYRNEPRSIFGFTPDTIHDDIGILVPMLLNGNMFKGRVKDDMSYFKDAARSPFGFVFVFWDVPYQSCMTMDCGQRHLQNDAFQTSKMYSFPPSAPRFYRNITNYFNTAWGITCFNCATYPASVGVQVPDSSGMFDIYLRALAEQKNAFCRCYIQGKWQHSQHCDRDREVFLFDVCVFDEPPTSDQCPKNSTLA